MKKGKIILANGSELEIPEISSESVVVNYDKENITKSWENYPGQYIAGQLKNIFIKELKNNLLQELRNSANHSKCKHISENVPELNAPNHASDVLENALNLFEVLQKKISDSTPFALNGSYPKGGYDSHGINMDEFRLPKIK